MGKTKPSHRIVPNGSLGLNLETADRHTHQVGEYIRKGSLPPSLLEKLRKKQPRPSDTGN